MSDSNREFEVLLGYLKQHCDCDLTSYKRGSLMRRFQYRLQQLGIENYGKYLQYIQDHPEESIALFNTVLINFSGFFRDRDSWNYLANTIIPQIIASKQPNERIRVWSAGCASGQEVYTLVMLLVEALGIEQYLQRVQIFATDVDDNALHEARQASYNRMEVADIPSGLLSKYFDSTEEGYVFQFILRRVIIFGHHDLAKDAPMSKIDLLVCRNVLIYFTPETQATIMVRFHFALTDSGFLFLGNSESSTEGKKIFTPFSLKHRIFTKGENLSWKEHLLIRPQIRNKKPLDPLTAQIRIWQVAFETSPFAQLAVDSSYRLLIANQQAFALFGLNNEDLGARVGDFNVGRLVSSFTFMKRLDCDRRPLHFKNIKWVKDENTIYLNIYIIPISDASGKLLGANLTFIDITSHTYFEYELKRLRLQLAQATQEIQMTKEVLESTNLELEYTQKKLENLQQEN
jgi:two-component system, chemotaxis family, CheB/CheR fusion protein